MIKQIIIAAAGTGSRMSAKLNIHHSKSLIEYNGKPLIHYLLASAKKAGIKEFFITANKNNEHIIRKVCKSLDILPVIKIIQTGFKNVPFLFTEYLDEKFLIACGHHFIPPEHFKKLIRKAGKFDVVFSTYANPPYLLDKKRKVLIVENIKLSNKIYFKLVDLEKETLPEYYTYARNPYSMSLKILKRFEKNKDYVSILAYKHWLKGGSVTAITSPMPPEFDYDDEFFKTKKFMDSYFKTQKSF